ncbi:diguanylate cyclase domain-containing protein [Pseudomonas borbori]
MPEQSDDRRAAAIAEQLRLHRLIALSWLLDGVLLAALAVLDGIGAFLPLVYLTIGLGSVAAGYWLTTSGYSGRFADPTMSFPLMLVAVANQCLGLWLAPTVGVFFLINIFQVFAYGLISLNLRHFRYLVGVAAALSAVPIMGAGNLIAFPLEAWPGRLLLFLVLVLCLARFVGVGVFVGKLRRRIEHKRAELEDSEARFRSLTELSSDWYWEQDVDYRFIRLATGNRNRGLNDGVLLNRAPWEVGFIVEMEGGWDAYRSLLARHQPFHDLVMKLQLDGRPEYVASFSGGPVFDRCGSYIGYRGVTREITERRLAEERIQYLATHDGLTGLPNRMLFNEMMGTAIQASRRYARPFAVLFIDLDGFKGINDSLGHDAGDALLQELAARFRHCMRASDLVARLGGDEFVVIANQLENDQQAGVVAQKLVDAASAPVVLCEAQYRVSASIGIALFPRDAQDEQGLLKIADSAMYQAKQTGKNRWRFHTATDGNAQ